MINNLATPLAQIFNLRLLHEQVACFVIAPVAAGKTQLCVELIQKATTFERVLFVSPLRALAEEVLLKWSKHESLPYIHVINLMNEDKDNGWKKFWSESENSKIEKKIGVVVVESLAKEKWREYFDLEGARNCLIIWDEWHLCLNWENFRPALLEEFFHLTSKQIPFVGLTATMPAGYFEQIYPGLSTNYSEVLHLNLGNYEWRNPPNKTLFFSKHFNLEKLFILCLKQQLINSTKNGKRFLIFVKRRAEVQWWLDWCQAKKIVAVGCVGGGVPQYLWQMEKIDPTHLRAIIATSVLGHGVNLPPIDEVVILGGSYDKELWVQMVGRGGRDGRKYRLWCSQLFGISRWRKVTHFIQLWIQLIGE
ncbi:MAG: DEAD/DEAH box helicase [Bacteriovoracaceae bacterium]|nr:DEAD/DEAH box helicase [Bacteriovoracaceae bacterium]